MVRVARALGKRIIVVHPTERTKGRSWKCCTARPSGRSVDRPPRWGKALGDNRRTTGSSASWISTPVDDRSVETEMGMCAACSGQSFLVQYPFPGDWMHTNTMTFRFDYDLTLSYAFSRGDHEHRRLAGLAISALEGAGLSIFLIREEEAANTKRWKRRYFEGLFRSRYLTPLLTNLYLRGSGAREEMDEIGRLVRIRRFRTFFHPLVPIAASVEDLREHAMQDAGAQYNFEWLRTHAFPVYLDWGADAIASFFKSIVRGSKGIPNLDWLRVLASGITSVRFDEYFGHRVVRVQLRNPLFEHDFEFHIGSGGTRYAGCLFSSRRSTHDIDPRSIVDEIQNYLDEESAHREPSPGEEMSCDNCGRIGLPASFEIGAECPHCGDQMSEMGAESARRLLTRRFGEEA